jgi:hypothetical protein
MHDWIFDRLDRSSFPSHIYICIKPAMRPVSVAAVTTAIALVTVSATDMLAVMNKMALRKLVSNVTTPYAPCSLDIQTGFDFLRGDECASDVGVARDTLTHFNFLPTLDQLHKFNASTNCKIMFESQTEAMASISPPCMLTREISTQRFAAVTFDQAMENIAKRIKKRPTTTKKVVVSPPPPTPESSAEIPAKCTWSVSAWLVSTLVLLIRF